MTSIGQMKQSEILGLAELQGFAVAALEGQDRRFSVGAHAQPMPGRPDDVAYARAVLEEVDKRVHIDTNRTFCTGYSRGARLCSRLASELSDRIAALGLMGGVRYPDLNNATKPMPLVAFHGLQDKHNAFEGHGASSSYWVRSVPDAVGKWVTFNGCRRTVSHELGPHAVLTMHVDCSADASVWLVKLSDAGHTWPGSLHNGRNLGFTNFEVSATSLMSSFFATPGTSLAGKTNSSVALRGAA